MFCTPLFSLCISPERFFSFPISSVNTEAEGPWGAVVEFASAAAAAKAIGQKVIHVGGKRVYVETS